MKALKILLTFSIVLSFHFITFAQEGRRLEDLYLKGRWKGVCATAVVDRVTLKHCELCSFVINPYDKQIASIQDIEIMFAEDTLTIKSGSQTTSLPYQRNKDNHSISFNYNNQTFNFNLFLDDKRRILVDSDGMVVVLEKLE